MNRTVSTLTAATAGVGLAVATTSAKAFIIAPALAAGIPAGGVLGGAAIGAAANNSYYYPNGYCAAPVAPAPTVAAAEPTVTVNSTSCYFTHRWIDGVRHRVRVCNTITP